MNMLTLQIHCRVRQRRQLVWYYKYCLATPSIALSIANIVRPRLHVWLCWRGLLRFYDEGWLQLLSTLEVFTTERPSTSTRGQISPFFKGFCWGKFTVVCWKSSLSPGGSLNRSREMWGTQGCGRPSWAASSPPPAWPRASSHLTHNVEIRRVNEISR